VVVAVNEPDGHIVSECIRLHTAKRRSCRITTPSDEIIY
jgi:hypothetical protein